MAELRQDMAINPREEPDPRFDPESDAENALAHEVDGEEPSGKPEPLEEIQSRIRRSLERAVQFYEEELEPDQVLATKYYKGEPFGDEKKGRSQVVSTDVRDATLAQVPDLLEIFAGPERAVEFRGRGPEDEPNAEQATDYINYLIWEENEGFLTILSWLKDGLIRRTGWVKWWYDEDTRVEASRYTGLDLQGLLALTQDEGVSGVEILGRDPAGMQFDVRVTRKKPYGCPRFACVPPEEVVYTPDARSVDEAPLFAHVREVAVDVLRQMGIPEDLIEEHKGKQRETSSDHLEEARQFHGGITQVGDEEEEVDETQEKIVYAEAYAWVDGDGDGVAELRLFQCVGPEYEIANGEGLGEIVDEVPFALFCPEPEPHTIPGLSNFDLLKDVQRVKSQLLRGTLDSLAQVINPPMEVVQGEVNMQDVLNPEVGGIIRVQRPGMLREVPHTFVGGAALEVLGYYDEVKSGRVGQMKGAAGIDADSLQSATKAAVGATLSAAQRRLKMIARIFAETGMKRLMKGFLRLVTKHQDQARVVRLRNQWVQVDPRAWDATMDVQVNVGLGQGTPEERIAALEKIAAAQQALLQAGSPLVSYVEIRYTLAKLAELTGWRHADRFFRPWGPQEEAQMQQQMAQQPPPPDPAMLMIQVEAQKVQIDAMVKQQEVELARWKAEREDDRERDKIARDAVLKEREIEAKNAVEIRDAELRAQIERDRLDMEREDRREQRAVATQAAGGEA